MKKNLLVSLMSLLCVAFMMPNVASASTINAAMTASSESVNNVSYAKVIPGSTLVVAKVEMDNLLDKSDVRNNTIVRAMFEQKIAQAPENIKNLLRNIFANPNNSGLNVDAPAYLALINVEKEQFILTFAMGNLNAFENTLMAITEGKLSKYENNGMTIINTGDQKVSLAYDSEKFIVVLDKVWADLLYYIQLSPENLAINNKKFAAVFNSVLDVKLAFNFDAFLQMMIQQGKIGYDMLPIVAMVKEYAMYASLDFENGLVNLKADINVEEEYKAFANQLIRKPVRRHFDYIPANSFAVLSYNFDLNQIYPILASTGVLNTLASKGINEETARLMLAALSGDYTAAAWIEGGNINNVQFMLAIDCADRSLFDLLVSYLIYEEGATMVDSDVYALNVNKEKVYNSVTYEYDVVTKGNDYFVVYKNNAIMVVPDNYYYKMNVNGDFRPLANNVRNNAVFTSMENNLVVDVKPIRESALNNIRNRGLAPDADERTAIEMLNMVNSITADFNIYSLDVVLNTSNKNINSLKLIVDKLISIAIQNSNLK